jgi:hypothetical protein
MPLNCASSHSPKRPSIAKAFISKMKPSGTSALGSSHYTMAEMMGAKLDRKQPRMRVFSKDLIISLQFNLHLSTHPFLANVRTRDLFSFRTALCPLLAALPALHRAYRQH